MGNGYDRLDNLTLGSTGTNSRPLFGDFNGDGCTDVATNQNGGWLLQYGTCLRTGATHALSAAVNTGVTAYSVYPMAIDWDGDGKDDIVEANAASGGTLGYAKSTGTTLNAWTSLGIAYNNSDTSGTPMAVVADTNGDGLYEVAWPVSSAHTVNVLPHQGATVIPDLATSFTNGFGFSYRPSYTQLTNTSYYQKHTGAVYPEQDYQGPMNVVASYTVSDGISLSGTYSISEFYFWARKNAPRQSFEGFGDIRSFDSRNSLYTHTYYSQAFPETGMVSQVTLATASKAYVSIVNTNTSATLDTTYKRYFPYTSQSVKTVYEYGGAIDGTLITQTTTAYAFTGPNGFNYGNPSQITTTTVDKDPASPWPGNPTFTDTINITPYEIGGTSSTSWCIHLPNQITETRTQPGGTPLTHTTSFLVNHNNQCEVDSKTVEPSNTTDQVLTALAYDSCGNVNSISVTGQKPDGTAMSARTTASSYGSHCIFPETINNAMNLNQITTLGYRYDLGLLTSAKDPNNLQTNWTYNDIGQKTLEQRPDGTQTSYGLTACVSHCSSSTPLEYYLFTQEQDSTTGHATFRQHYDYFDQLDRVIKDQVQNTSGNFVDIWSSFDSLGRAAQKSMPYLDAGTQYFTTYAYDPMNRVTSVSRPTSATDPTVESTIYTYQGRTNTVKDPRLNTTTYQSDVIGELRIVTDPDNVAKTNYSYDQFSNLTMIQDPGGNQTHRYFDALGYLLKETQDPDRGDWHYQYDSVGELVNLRDAKTTAPSWTQQLSYDALGRTTQRIESEGTTMWTWGTSAAAHEIGQLKQLSGLGDVETNSFDSVGRLSSRSMTWGSSSWTAGYSYNTLGTLSVLTYPLASGQSNAFAVKYSYTNGYVSSVQNYTGGVAGTTFWQLTSGAVNMDTWGHVTDETLGTTSAVRIQSGFDAVTSWLNTRTVGSGGSLNNLQNLSYQWDLNGNLGQRQDNKQNLIEGFNYDNLNRIQNSTLNGTQNLAVGIDATGNITSRTDGGITYGYSYDTTHTHAVHTVGTSPNQTTYTYDANGNMATRNGLSITWASYNLPTNINGANGVYASFGYGADRQRKQQTAQYVADGQSGVETTFYVFGLYEYEMTPAQNHNKYYIQAPGGTRIIYDIQSVNGVQTTYITSDHLGSGNIVLNSAGTTQINESYSAFGYRRSSNWSGPLSGSSSDYTTVASTTRRGYTDAFHELVDNLNLIHMNGRVYDPAIGRFMSPDPIAAYLGRSQSVNPYSYALNNPLSLIDPSGFDTEPVCPPGADGKTILCEVVVPSGSGGGGTPPPSNNDFNQLVNDLIDWLFQVAALNNHPVYRENNGGGDGPEQGGHDYRTQNKVCNRALTPSEQRDLLSRFSVPSIFRAGWPSGNGEYVVTNSEGIPGGLVRTTYAANGLSVTNLTTPLHVFVGTINRSTEVSNGATYIDTHGYGNAGDNLSGDDPLGPIRDVANQESGPGIFNQLDSLAARYAAANYSGC